MFHVEHRTISPPEDAAILRRAARPDERGPRLPLALTRVAFLEALRRPVGGFAILLGAVGFLLLVLLPVRFREPSAFYLAAAAGPFLLHALAFSLAVVLPTFAPGRFPAGAGRIGPQPWSGPVLTGAVGLGLLGAWGLSVLVLAALGLLGLGLQPWLQPDALGLGALEGGAGVAILLAVALQGLVLIGSAALVGAVFGRRLGWVVFGLLVAAGAYWAPYAHRPDAGLLLRLGDLLVPALDLLRHPAQNVGEAGLLGVLAASHVLVCNLLCGLVLERRAGGVAGSGGARPAADGLR